MTTQEDAQAYYWYHCIRLGDYITDGDYDMDKVLHHYRIPQDLHGKKVLDVGRASGYFSFLMEERGAEVVATDLPSYLNWDFVGGDTTVEERSNLIGSEAQFTKHHILGAFDFAHQFKMSQVKSKLINVYDLSPEAVGGRFDLVFCGSLLSHLRDPILALERLYSVTGDQLILSCPIFNQHEGSPLMALVGTADSDRRSWWVPNLTCATEMLKCANFQRIQLISKFQLVHRKLDLVVHHAVFHAFRNA
jgi:tRNA (mo5U34)-methyltransferase